MNYDPKKLEEFLKQTPNIESAKIDAFKTETPKPQEEPKPVSLFVPGDLITVLMPDGEEEYRILNNEDGKVTIRSVENYSKPKETFSEEELGLKLVENQKDVAPKTSYAPMQELFAAFNYKTNWSLPALLSWKKRWVDSGTIDTYRKSNAGKGDLVASDAQVGEAKEALDVCIEALQTEGLSRDSLSAAASNVSIYARIITGIHNEKSNDIEWHIKNYTPGKNGFLDTLRAAIKKAKEPAHSDPKTPSEKETEPEEKPPTPPDVRSTWPRNIVHDQKRGWLYTNSGSTEILPTETWNAAEANIRPVFDDYLKFMTGGGMYEQQEKIKEFPDLIELKNQIITALQEKDPEGARVHAETLSNFLTSSKGSWNDWQKNRQEKAAKLLSVKSREEVLSATDKHYSEEVGFFNERLVVLRPLLSIDELKLIESKFETLKEAKSGLKQYVEDHGAEDEEDKQLQAVQTNYGMALKSLEETFGEKERANGERLAQAKKEKGMDLKLIRSEQQFGPKRLAARVAVNRLIDRSENAPKQEDVAEVTKRKQEVQDKYEAMFEEDENAFIGLYATASVDTATNQTIYRENERLRIHPMREVITAVLKSHNIHLTQKTGEMKSEEHALEQEKELLRRKAGSTVYSPAAEQEKKYSLPIIGAFGPKKNPSGMVNLNKLQPRIGAVQTVSGIAKDFKETQNKVEEAKTKKDVDYTEKLNTLEDLLAKGLGTGSYFQSLRTKLAAHISPENEPELAKLKEREATIEKWISEAKEKKPSLDSISVTGLRRAVKEYEEAAEAFLLKKEKERGAPKTPEAAEARKEALKKVEAIMNTRVEALTKNKKNLLRGKLSWAILALAALTAGGVQLNKYLESERARRGESNTEQTASAFTKPKENLVQTLAEKNLEASKLLSDIQTLSQRDLMYKHAPAYFDGSKDPAKMALALGMFGHIILNDNQGNTYHLSDAARGQLSNLQNNLETISIVATGKKPTANTFETIIAEIKKISLY